eukprot:TRINITY_DN107959_c0_g1_i1.p1 TRINITY_DN107959_c0_g1~~TRINITY_DN107959_c0_g1_i1.p1  ORF type:complete len:736 (-),score=112.57 TRINITY_DN107959_c0_g1_i1:47-2221(-)
MAATKAQLPHGPMALAAPRAAARSVSPCPHEALKAPRQHWVPAVAAQSFPDAADATAGGASSSSSTAGPPEQFWRLGNLHDRVCLQSVSRLGSGSLGVVLLAQDQRTREQLAIKAISLKLAKLSGAEEERVWQEAKVMREVQHPNLARLLDVLACWDHLPHVNSEPPYLCLVMEYVADSEPLSNAMRRRGPSRQLAERVVPQLAAALAEMHRRGIVHRDVWSENVLIDERERAVLVDLGCSEYISSRPAVNSKLNIPYMSPEAAAGMPQGTGDDCWALGLLITEMVTGCFVADRIGRSDMPIHFNRAALFNAQSEAISSGGPVLGKVTGQLLEFSAFGRMSMAEVLEQLSPEPCISSAGSDSSGTTVGGSAAILQGSLARRSVCQPSIFAAPQRPGRATLAVAPTSLLGAASAVAAASRPSGGGRSPMRLRVSRDVSPLPITGGSSLGASWPSRASIAVDPGENPPGGRAAPKQFISGQTVLYCPQSHPGIHKATVLGRTVDGRGWRIRVDQGGIEEVDDSEEWRLCLSDEPPAMLPGTTQGEGVPWPRSSSPSRVRKASPMPFQDFAKATVSTSPASQAPVSSATTTATVSAATTATVSTTATGASVPAPVPQRGAGQMQAAVRSPGHAGAGCRAYASPPSPPVPVRPGMRGSYPGVAVSAPSIASQLQPGRRILYTARSNGLRYPGVVVGCLAGRPGYCLYLDCGEPKEVEEAEAWRIVPST